MKKLLIFHSALAPYRVDFFNALADNFDCTVVFLSRNNRNQPFDQSNLLSHCRFHYVFMDIKLVIKGRDWNFGYLYYLLKYKPDIVIGGEYGLPTLMPYIYKLFIRKKYALYTICDDSLKIAEECKGIRKRLRDSLVKRLDGFIFISEEVANWYKKNFHLSSDPIVFPIIKNEKNYRQILREAVPVSTLLQEKFDLLDKRVLLYVGRLTEVKNLSFLISTFSEIKREDVRLVLVGEGGLKKELKSYAYKLGIGHKVLFAGRFEGNELYAWYNLANLFILPSKYEPFGAVTAEALQAGCPVLCSRNAGSSTLIREGINGYLFDPYDSEEFLALLESSILTMNPLFLNSSDMRTSLLPYSFDECIKNMVNKLR